MRSSVILAIHTAMFATLMLASPSLSMTVIYYPEVVSGAQLLALSVTGILVTFGLWRKYGQCPLTEREKEALINEGKQPYDGPWFSHYARVWFGLHLTERFGTFFSLAFLVGPMPVGIIYW